MPIRNHQRTTSTRLVGAVICIILLPFLSQAGAQTLWSDGFESPRLCQWSKVVTPEICDGRDNDCDGQIDEGGCVEGSTCTLPAQVTDTNGARVVGTGTPASCPEAALDAAIADAGAAAITFDCGPAPLNHESLGHRRVVGGDWCPSGGLSRSMRPISTVSLNPTLRKPG